MRIILPPLGDTCVADFSLRHVQLRHEQFYVVRAITIWVLHVLLPTLRIGEHVLSNSIERILSTHNVLEVVALPEVIGRTGTDLVDGSRHDSLVRTYDGADGCRSKL